MVNIDSGECIWEFAQKMRSSDMGLIRINLDFPIVWAFPESLFREGGVLANFQAFINVYKHYGPTAVDLDPRSKIQDYRKNFLDPRSGSKIQDPRLQKKLLGSKVWIQDPRFQEKLLGSKIQDPRFQKKLLGSKVWIQDPRFQEKLLGSTAEPILGPGKALSSDPRSFLCNLGSWILDPDLGSKKCFLESWILDLGSKKFFLESWILDLGSRPWIQEVFSVILDLGSWIQINCYGSIVFINVYKRLQTCQNHPLPGKGPNYWKIPGKMAEGRSQGGYHIYIYISLFI